MLNTCFTEQKPSSLYESWCELLKMPSLTDLCALRFSLLSYDYYRMFSTCCYNLHVSTPGWNNAQNAAWPLFNASRHRVVFSVNCGNLENVSMLMGGYVLMVLPSVTQDSNKIFKPILMLLCLSYHEIVHIQAFVHLNLCVWKCHRIVKDIQCHKYSVILFNW